MSDRAVVTLRTQADRDKAVRWCQGVATGSKVVFHGPGRTIPQNDALHAAIGDIARQRDYHGVKLPVREWKLLFLDALDREVRMLPNLDGTGFVSVGKSTSDLSKDEFTGLLSVVYEWGNRNGIEWSDKPDE
jgi:adenylate kinase family enzyme